MSQPKHTAGPWEYTVYDKSFFEISVGLNKIGEVYDSEADARLIAAAPELLEALKAVLPYVLHVPLLATIKATVCAAIAKAEGTTP